MARAALGWGVRELGKKAGVSANTVARFENGADAHFSTVQNIERALIEGGIRFIPADDEFGPGVRLRALPQPSNIKKT